MTFPILTARVSDNAEVFAEILELYVSGGSLVADITWGRGAFWKESAFFNLMASDILPSQWADLRADFRNLPYSDETFDAVVFDPPYGQLGTSPRQGGLSETYNLKSGRDVYHTEHLYREGILEGNRILKRKGVLIVKCQDQVNGGKQHRWSYFVYWVCADFLKMEDLDQFVVVQKRTPIMRHKHQIHARKNHSFFWVFRKR